MKIKDKIKLKRLELGLTLEEVANKVGVAKSTIKKWESGQINSMRQSKIIALANALNVEPTFLIFEEENINEEKQDIKETKITSLDHVILSLFKNLNDKEKAKVIKFTTKLIEKNRGDNQ